jgi:hypothetical protein
MWTLERAGTKRLLFLRGAVADASRYRDFGTIAAIVRDHKNHSILCATANGVSRPRTSRWTDQFRDGRLAD